MRNLDSNRNWIGNLSSEVQTLIDEISIFKTLNKGETLYDVKAKGDYLFQIVSGRIEARIPYENGASVLLDILTPGDCFGEIQFIREEVFLASYIAAAKTVIRQIPRQDFLAIQKQHPEISEQWLIQFAERLNTGITMYSNYAAQRLPARIATRLYYEIRKGQECEEVLQTVDLNITQENLADILGSSRDSISKIFKLWAEEGIIKLGYGRVTILDAKRLLQLSAIPPKT